VRSIDPTTEVGITVSFDDTPSLEDTKFDNRQRNTDLMRDYSEKYYPTVRMPTNMPKMAGIPDIRSKAYPNLIVLVASWDSIKRDDNELANFTSSMGKIIYYLSHTGLFDDRHPNVVVVVTKALTFMTDYHDLKSKDAMNQQWMRDTDEKAKIINDLRLKVFPDSDAWRVVFVENGGGKDIHGMLRILPNGERSHYNLFDAIVGLLTESQDLVGALALRLISGADISRLEPTEREILCQCPDSGVPPRERRVEVSPLINSRFPPSTVIYYSGAQFCRPWSYRQHKPNSCKDSSRILLQSDHQPLRSPLYHQFRRLRYSHHLPCLAQAGTNC
jgi:hypothetical protein